MFDGAIVDFVSLPGLVRETAINAGNMIRTLKPYYQTLYPYQQLLLILCHHQLYHHHFLLFLAFSFSVFLLLFGYCHIEIFFFCLFFTLCKCSCCIQSCKLIYLDCATISLKNSENLGVRRLTGKSQEIDGMSEMSANAFWLGKSVIFNCKAFA